MTGSLVKNYVKLVMNNHLYSFNNQISRKAFDPGVRFSQEDKKMVEVPKLKILDT